MSDGFSWLRDYDADRRGSASEIAKSYSEFKILLKTKDEATLLRPWIEHHLKIVGPEDILIFDHGSTDPKVGEIYREYSPSISVWRYGGFHNVIHHRRYQHELYQALHEACRYYIFLDTDEFLIQTDGQRFSCDEKLVDLISHDRSIRFHPGVWLHNVMGYGNRFQVGVNIHPLIGGLKWGKPILASDMGSAEIQMHNMQVFESYRARSLCTNFLVLHRNFISPGHRIKANMRKLVTYRVIASADDMETVMKMRPEHHGNPTCQRFIKEVQKLSALPEASRGDTSQSLRLDEGGTIFFETREQREIFRSFVINPDLAWVGWA